MSNKRNNLGTLSVNGFSVYGIPIKVRKNQPVVFYIEYDFATASYFVEDQDLGICAYSNKKESMLRELNDNLAMVWTNYAKEKNKNLTPDAITIKKNLLKLFLHLRHACEPSSGRK